VHPTNRKVYLILLSVSFNGIIKSQGVKVKLMVCKTDSKQNAQKCRKQTFSKMQNQQLFNEKTSFLFQIYKDFMQ
jgi:hypothetical protein